jgi:pimeloyl-ACP methyl ester carboxylesterase
MDRTAYRTVGIDGLSVFYREAGPPDAPTILLLHGFPARRWHGSAARMLQLDVIPTTSAG